VNGDGRLDPGEPPVAGAAVLLEDDRRAVSDAGGRFEFRDLPEGVYRIEVDAWDLPVGLRPAAARPAVLTVSRGVATLDLPVHRDGTD